MKKNRPKNVFANLKVLSSSASQPSPENGRIKIGNNTYSISFYDHINNLEVRLQAQIVKVDNIMKVCKMI